LELVIAGWAVVVGILSQMLGLGGGILLVPLLTLVYGYPIQQVVPASLVGVMGMSVFASTKRTVPFGLLSIFEVTSLLGGMAGGYLAQAVSGDALRKGFAFLAVLVGIRFFLLSNQQLEGGKQLSLFQVTGISPQRLALLALFFGGVATVASMLGIGGGIFIVPALVTLGGVSMKDAAGMSHYLMGSMSAGALMAYVERGTLDIRLGAPIFLGLFVGGWLSSFIPAKSHHLKWVFSGVMLVTAWRMGWY
jgi:uncharacterized protein